MELLQLNTLQEWQVNMAVPNSRRVLFGSYVVPQESTSTGDTSEELENGFGVGKPSYTKYIIDPTVRRTLGGKGTVAITANQGNNGWTTMTGNKTTWDMMDDTTNATGDRWEDCHQVWGGEMNISGVTPLMPYDVATLKFIYIENTGANEVKLALEGNEYDILIPSGASVSLRLADSTSTSTCKLSIDSGTSTVKYIQAK